MILNAFPNLTWLRAQAESAFQAGVNSKGEKLQNPGWPTVILNVETEQTYRDNIRGPLSLFCNLSGESNVECEKKRSVVKEGSFFVTNHNQYYTLEVSNRKTETFNIHFGELFADRVLASLVKPERMLENTFTNPLQALAFHNKLHLRTPEFNDLISKIRRSNGDSLSMEEHLYELMVLLINDRQRAQTSELSLPSLRSSTRAELMRRLFIATDYIQTFYDKDLSLDELAAACSLSKFHFLRLFKIAFRKTPHAYLNEVRMKRAEELVRKSKVDVFKVASQIGIKDSSSFSRMFRKHYGAYPTQYRSRLS
jgi:AraC family transcriptional regulator